mmetsp:Transcript_36625/g.105376  ORF Transcript_36625/g.105376 Transcript_36625/m.105376 type:complete len:631 (+) Transcript_36625:150-2042(+)
MKPYPVKLLLAALAVESATCFVPNSLNHRSKMMPLFAANQDAPLDTKAVMSAYDEWRQKFGKGDFDINRFHNFENNFRVLTAANIKARDKALAAGRDPPQWLELNEYGDFSREEYKAMQGGKSLVTPGQDKNNLTVDGMVRRTQMIKPPQRSGPSDSSTRSDQDVPQQAAPGSPSASSGTQVVRKAEQPQQQTRGTQVVSRAGTPTDNNPSQTPSGTSFGTQVIQKSGDAAPRGTQVISKASPSSVNNLYGPPASSGNAATTGAGTQVIQRGPSPAPRGTQVVSRGSPYGTNQSIGTQVIRKADSSAAPRGTQVVSRASPGGTNDLYGPPSQSSDTSEQPNSSFGTQVIRSDNSQPRGTQVISKAPAAGNYFSGAQPSNRGTQVISRAPGSQSSARTQYFQGSVDQRGTYVVQAGDTGNTEAPRGTRVISQDQSQNPIGDFLDSANDFMKNSGGTQVIQQAGQRATNSIFSLFGGSKNDEGQTQPVGGTVKIQGSDQAAEGQKQTVLVDMSDLQKKIPSIFSFFGGTKSEEDEEEKEQQSAPEPPASSQPAKPPTRPTLIIDKNSAHFPRNQELPELRRWWQNSDGTIVGYIYNSKNFNDGTKLTSSKLQRAACRAGNVLRSGGEEYLLK